MTILESNFQILIYSNCNFGFRDIFIFIAKDTEIAILGEKITKMMNSSDFFV